MIVTEDVAVSDPELLAKWERERPDPLGLRKIDHVRFFVGNARQSAYFYRNAFGFDVVAYAGLETRHKHEAGYVLRQGQITFVLTSPLSWNHHEAYRLMQHGDGVMDKSKTIATWPYGGNFHEFAFGLLYDKGYFYLNLSVAIDYGGATTDPQPAPGRGVTVSWKQSGVAQVASLS